MGLEDAGNEADAAFRRDDKMGLDFENVFAGATSFLRRRYTTQLDGYQLAITGVPFDQAVTHRPGARFGPRALRTASAGLAGDPPFGWGFSPLEEFAIADVGDMAFDYAKTGELPARIEAHAEAILRQGVECLTLGGDHSITLPLLRAHARKHGPLALLQFDAHSDTWEDNESDNRVDHGTGIFKAVNEGLIDPTRSVQVGIRVENEPTMGILRLDALSVHRNGPAATAARIKEVVGDHPTYVSFDIDALDPAFAPGTGTPVWAGLTTPQVAVILRGLAGLNLVGMDVVEVSPPYDHADMTAIAGAHIGYELICLWAWTRRNT